MEQKVHNLISYTYTRISKSYIHGNTHSTTQTSQYLHNYVKFAGHMHACENTCHKGTETQNKAILYFPN